MIKTASGKMYINGAVVDSKQTVNVYNPAATKEVVGEIALGSSADVDRAVEAAECAWSHWRSTPPEERAKKLEQMAAHIEEHQDELIKLLVRENGKLFSQAKRDVLGGANVLRYYSTLAHELNDRVIDNEQGRMILARQPMGVVSIIVPWNSPVLLGSLMLAPALLAGNTVLIKPSNYCPLTVGKVLNDLAEMLPAGVLNVLLGSGSTVGEAMVKHPKVRKISFTGSTEVGASVLRNAADTIKNVTMELGGNDAALVLKDADVNQKLVDELIKGVFTNSGQICYNVKRIYVHRDNYDAFVKAFIQSADRIRVGFGLDERATMGPVNNKAQYESIMNLIKQLEETDAVVHQVGDFVEGTNPSDGYFILPRIVTNVTQEDPIVQQEQFGPIVPIIPYDTEEEGIALVNDTEFGLGNSVWTTDVERGFEVARNLQSGSVFVNIHRGGASAVNMPFGGFKQSGIGRGHGVEALLALTELQALIHRVDL
ncbi:aldehyde dehydrogenase family protein [Bacillus sp. Marseille-P3661]|uniref:aldehyde dehydrogenase family protein n=1 Tax=Bacillus sp. Marseille-P3661 TaxID=1936234 RepID=UPI000C815577|nr:aldehyde dehydrogenase family protein [Bacillus sp. Marseille-P3661]